MALVKKSQYSFPAGYSKYLNPSYKSYASGPAGNIRGALQVLTTAGVPANLSVLQVVPPGSSQAQPFNFQFLYPAAVLAAGNIGVSLPLGAGSTTAQVTTALNAVLAQLGATPQGGVFTGFPWIAIQGSPTTIGLNWTVAGSSNPGISSTGVTNITSAVTAPQASVLSPVVPIMLGKSFSFMPGV